MKTLTGTGYGNARQFIDIPRMVQHYQAGRLDLDRLVSHRYKLEEINEGVERLRQGEAARASWCSSVFVFVRQDTSHAHCQRQRPEFPL